MQPRLPQQARASTATDRTYARPPAANIAPPPLTHEAELSPVADCRQIGRRRSHAPAASRPPCPPEQSVAGLAPVAGRVALESAEKLAGSQGRHSVLVLVRQRVTERHRPLLVRRQPVGPQRRLRLRHALAREL